MPIEKINFAYPKGELQSVFDTDALTALELAAKTSKKVDECVDLVNGVEQSAIEATAVVDEMKTTQEQFVLENNDIREHLVTDNQTYIDSLNASKTTFDASMTTALNLTKTNMDLALSEYQTTANNTLTDFTASINATKAQVIADANAVIANADAQITADVTSKIDSMETDGSLAQIINVELFATLNATISANEVVVSATEPLTAKTWFDSIGETSIEINGESVILQEI